MAISEADGEIHKYFSDHRYKVKFSAKSRPVLSVFTQSALSWLQNVRKPYSSISCQADFSFSKLNLFFLFWFAFWGGAVEDKAPCLPFCKKALCCSDLLMPHDPVGTLNKVYDMCNDYQFKNYISFICFCYIHSDPVLILKCLWHSFLCYFQQKVFSNINSVLMIISKWILIKHFDQ